MSQSIIKKRTTYDPNDYFTIRILKSDAVKFMTNLINDPDIAITNETLKQINISNLVTLSLAGSETEKEMFKTELLKFLQVK